MLKYLLEQVLKARTYCNVSNPMAVRFVRSVGFVPYRYTKDEVFMWITENRLKGNSISQRWRYMSIISLGSESIKWK